MKKLFFIMRYSKPGKSYQDGINQGDKQVHLYNSGKKRSPFTFLSYITNIMTITIQYPGERLSKRVNGYYKPFTLNYYQLSYNPLTRRQ